MKTVFVLRHAKSSWDNAALSDFDRPLNERGRATAPFMGKVLKKKGFVPELIVSSPAKRAKQTAKLVKDSAGFDCPLKFDERIYEASPQKLRKVISETSDDLDSMMIVGHNPGMEGLIGLLTEKSESMPTAAIAVIELDISKWSAVGPATGSLKEIIRPKDVH